MSISLNSVRYLTSGDPYHYTVDNRPLGDLAQRDNTLKTAIETAYKQDRLTAVTSGFLARGYTTQNMMIGKLNYPGGLSFQVVRSFIVQEVEVDPIAYAGVLMPALGVSQTAQTFNFTTPAVGYIRPVSIQARRKTPTADHPPYYTGSSQNDANIIYDIEYQVKNGTDSLGTLVYPSIDPGWIEVFRLAIGANTSLINSSNVERRSFKEEGQLNEAAAATYEYKHEHIEVTLANTSDTFTGITVNCNYGFVFVDGAIQYDVTRLSETSIQFPEVIPPGSVIDIIVTAGGQAVPADNTRSFQNFTATDGQTVFTGVNGRNATSLVFITGLLQAPDTWSINDNLKTLTLSSAAKAGEVITVLEVKAIPFGQPHIPGGTIGQALVKNSSTDDDYSWQDINPPPSIPGGAITQMLVKNTATDNDFVWVNQVRTPCQGIIIPITSVSYPSITLMPYNGNQIVINGVARAIPDAGINVNFASTVTASGISLYSIYAYWTGSAISLEAVPYSTSSFVYRNGMPVKITGVTVDQTRLFVGMMYPVAGAAYQLLPDNVRSWFNGSYSNTISSSVGEYFGRTDLADVNSFTQIQTYSHRAILMPGDNYECTVSGNVLATEVSQKCLALYSTVNYNPTTPYLATSVMLSTGRAAMTIFNPFQAQASSAYSLTYAETIPFYDNVSTSAKIVNVSLYGSSASTVRGAVGVDLGTQNLTGLINRMTYKITRNT